jgi:putative tricarboxylic transport membrane protein
VSVTVDRPNRRSPLTAIFHYSTAITLLGAWVIWQATLLREGPGYAAVGPKTFPLIVGVGMLLSGLALIWERLHRPRDLETTPTQPADVEGPADWQMLISVGVALAAYLALYEPFGFVLSSTLFLPTCAWILGSRAPIRDVVVGLGLALVTYVLFTRFLGLELPGGPIDEQLRALSNLGRPPVGLE